MAIIRNNVGSISVRCSTLENNHKLFVSLLLQFDIDSVGNILNSDCPGNYIGRDQL